MNGKPGTKAECDALATARDELTFQGRPYVKLLDSLYNKLTAPYKPKPAVVDARAVQDVLVQWGAPTIIPVATAGEAWWAQMGRRLTAAGATKEDAVVIGAWLGTQTWARNMTIDRVVSGWPSYLARARKAGNDPGGWSRPEFGDVAE